ncbi:MAG TPA: Uma2 family endonuclease [Pyrinomonadaceae bacterium]|nr:Uma2 family endonuclease [Pyrinomonadaceae bacterium]
MSQVLTEQDWELGEIVEELDELVENLKTEDDEPVDNILSAKQQRLLTETLYSSWKPSPIEENSSEPRPFFTDANIGIFYSVHSPPIVPDVFISLDVSAPKDLFSKKGRSYPVWEIGKVPEVVVEIVSNKEGGELDRKLNQYARMGVRYYVVYDPFLQLSEDILRVYEPGLANRFYLRQDYNLINVELSLTLWEGKFEDTESKWLRWVDKNGDLLPTADEKAAIAEDKVRQAEIRAQLLAEKLRELGVDPDQIA